MLKFREVVVDTNAGPVQIMFLEKGSTVQIEIVAGPFFMQITCVICVTNVRLAQAYPTCTVCAFHSLIAEALCQIDYPVN